MKIEEVTELMEKARQDGAQLFVVASVLYKVLIILTCVSFFAGFLFFFFTLVDKGLGPALIVALITAGISAMGYAFAVLSSFGAKVIVHLLFSNLAILEKMKDKSDESV